MKKDVKSEKEKIVMPKKENKKNKVKKVKKENYFGGVKKELKQVKWPEMKDVWKYTLATVIFILIFVGFFVLLNLLMSVIKGMF